MADPAIRPGAAMDEAHGDRPAHRKVALLGGILLVLTAAIGAIGVVSLRSMQRDLQSLVMRDGRMLTELTSIQELAVRTQLSLEQAASATGAEQVALLQQHVSLIDAMVAQWERTSAGAAEVGVRTDSAALGAWLDAVSAGRRQIESGSSTVDLRESQLTHDALVTSLDGAIGPMNARVAARAEEALDRADLANQVMAAAVAVGLIGGALVATSSYRAVRDQHRKIAQNDRQRAAEAERQRIQSQVSQALEFARDDAGALKATELALRDLTPARPAELLLADSSRAHFELGLRSSPADGLPGCRVPTPSACPAVTKGQALQFPDSERFDACPYLRDRPAGPLSAVCVPVSISGTAEGVLHSVGPHGEVVDDQTRFTLEYLANRAGDRIGVLRAFSRSEAQAATDPLTGLANRRSFEDRVGAWLRQGQGVTIAFGDIDHFKQLNDTHGHDVGDRALRTFSRTFRDSVRPGDLIARWGGEEFVAAFPNTAADDAVAVLQRVQRALAELVSAGIVPAFTVSFGVADQYDGDDLESLVLAADGALLQAKRSGRNRVLRANTRPSAGAPLTVAGEPGQPRASATA